MSYLTENKQIKTLIVDDERLAVEGLKMLLEDYPNIQILGSAACLDEAVCIIDDEKPDLIFLDIQLQGETGFDLFTRIPIESKVVFVTAFDQYAVRAFEVNALDYLLKPVSKKRFAATINRVYKESNDADNNPQNFEYNDVIFLNAGTIRFARIRNIKLITAEGDYSRIWIHNEKDEMLLRSLKAWEAILPGKYFYRVHRSSIVNLDYIETIEKTTSNRYLLYLSHFDQPIVISQRRSADLKKKISL
jgi:two-component system LytT family response regulator